MSRVTRDDKSDVLVASSPCDQCLFSKNKVVGDERKAEFLAACEAKGAAFLCHKHTIRGMQLKGAARSRANRVACHLHFKNYGHLLVYRIAAIMERLIFVNAQGEETNGETQEPTIETAS
jgi:hypothetical protein